MRQSSESDTIQIVQLIIMIFLYLSCGGSSFESNYLPESLPSEDSIKETLSSDVHLSQLNEKAHSLGKNLQEWKESEKSLVSDQEINTYWQREKVRLRNSIPDTDAIDRLRESIRLRIVWSRIFHKTNINIKQKPIYQSKSNLLTQLDVQYSPQFGNKKAKWVIVEWSDYLCGFCKKTFPHTKNLLLKYKTQIHYIHKDFPLDGESDQSLIPLVVSRCLWEKDPTQFSLHMQLLYAHANHLAKGEAISSNHWNYFTECISQTSNARYRNLVEADWEEAKKLGVSSVPTFWVNGRWILGALDAETWERVLEDTKP
ncbi:oxidoreductase [Leptospira biflexa]|uniref:thioredoxin domain-containing protein n=1 Tax=Leptospira biflexa TaxID=172 RepID=UPI001090F68B|nr:thioredoxin domain-containing protein [Leptospira biflexa]TGM52109.1 oxidoreductase [Leptospira biflexa]